MVASLRLDRTRKGTRAWITNPRSPVKMPHPNAEVIPEDAVFNSAYSRALSDFRDEDAAQGIAFGVADEFTATVEKKMSRQRDRDGGTHPVENPAYYLDAIITLENRKRKEQIIKEHKKGKQALSKTDLWLWIIEDLLHYAKSRKSPYMATAMMMVLCDLPSFKIPMLYSYLADGDSDSDEVRDDSTFRRYKLNYIIPEMRKRYDSFVEVQQIEKNEKRLAKEAHTERYREMFETWLEQLTPLHPQCFLPNSFDPSAMEEEYINQNASVYPDGIERNRKHIMQCPKCLTRFLAAVGFADWKESFTPPRITLQGPDSGDNDPSGRTKPRNVPAQPLAMMKRMLDRRSIRRQRLSLKSLFVAVDTGAPRKIHLNQTIELRLSDGDRLIRVSGKDWQGRLPLDSHLISWNEDIITEQPILYTTLLKGDRVLQFSVRYHPDMMSATAVVEYLSVPKHSPEHNGVRAPIWPELLPAGGLAAVGVAVVLLTSLASSLWPKHRTSEPVADSGLARFKNTTSAEIESSKNTVAAEPKRLRVESPRETDNTTKIANQSGEKARAVPRRYQQAGNDLNVKESRLRRSKSKAKQANFDIAKSRHSNGLEMIGSAMSKAVKKTKKGAGSVAGSLVKRIGNLISASPATPPGEPVFGTNEPAITDGSKVLASSPESAPPVPSGVSGTGVRNLSAASLDMLSTEPSIVGIVTDVDDQPVPLANILLKPHKCETRDVEVISSGQSDIGVGALSRADGRFTLRHAGDGTYDLLVQKAGFIVARRDGIKVLKGAAVPSVQIRLESERVPETSGERSYQR